MRHVFYSAAAAAVLFGCTQDFEQFRPSGGNGGSGTGGVPTTGGQPQGGGGQGGNGGNGGIGGIGGEGGVGGQPMCTGTGQGTCEDPEECKTKECVDG